MKGYLMQEKDIVRGEDTFIESVSPENRNAVVFEDDGETAYFYAMEMDESGGGMKILDALHIYEEPGGETSKLLIVWSRDWMKCALVLDGYCQAIFDFEAHGGYSINEFPPPNEIWTQGDRKLTNELISRLF
ncbi:MAG TPA: DUF2251 domain-containing protein [Puia sp.]|uniref:DUF2251 domain-containing protein n=1 Tax=Puia sp. TaxID=2045100 RepID=UPI002C83151D|nr:DUF2251 domain-containing protein [Puia sp.]HVU98744.1 DUF2251 domain-containing protein [Puia sp.]